MGGKVATNNFYGLKKSQHSHYQIMLLSPCTGNEGMTLYYISVRRCTMIGQFSKPYFTVETDHQLKSLFELESSPLFEH